MDYVADVDKAWIKDLEHVFKYGLRAAPRGMLVYESLAYMSVIPMQSPIIRNPIRKLGYKFMAAEAAWILSGDDRVKTIAPYSKDISKFSDDGESFFGAYGPKVMNQLPYVVSALHQDPFSRQAVVNIWRENPLVSKDIPCTLSLQFVVRNNTIHCIASMRSSDLWLGHPYDIFNFSAISFAVLLQLNTIRRENGDLPVVLGNLMLTAGSKHIYDRNAEQISDILHDYEENGVPRVERHPIFVESRYDRVDEFIHHLWECANSPIGALDLEDK